MGRELKETQGLWAVHETVSEKEEKVTPSFKTKQEVAEYLTNFGDFLMQQYKKPPLPKEVADAFIKIGFVPSASVGSNGFRVNYYCALDFEK